MMIIVFRPRLAHGGTFMCVIAARAFAVSPTSCRVAPSLAHFTAPLRCIAWTCSWPGHGGGDTSGHRAARGPRAPAHRPGWTRKPKLGCSSFSARRSTLLGMQWLQY